MKDIERVPIRPFTRFCMSIGAVPSSYLAGLTIEEQLLWLCSFLEKEVVPVVNNNSEVVEELKNYVEHYFDNLDVQEEINNKLDEMAEGGELEEIIASYLNTKAMICFDNVQDLKDSTNLEDGSYARTLGYYEKNDCGGAIYKIREITNSDVVDNKFILSMTNDNSLIAELIYNDRVNIKQIGAYGDGVHDDSVFFQAANDYLANIIRNSDIANVNTIEIPGGKYRFDNQLVLAPYIKLRTTGYAALLSYVTSDSMIHISPSSLDLEQSIGDRQDWYRGPIIEGDSGLLIKFMGQDNTNSIAIEVGLDYEYEKGVVSRFSIQEFRILGFNIGILFNRFHVYLGEMRRISFENNIIGVQYSDIEGNPVDAGERMTYQECLFARNDIGVKWMCQGFDSNFINTSFDYVKCVFYDPNNKGYRYINVTNSHFEGIGIANKSDLTIPSGIIFGQMKSSKININNSDVYLSIEDYLFYCNPSINGDYVLSFDNNKLAFPNGHNKKGLYFLATKNITILNGIDNSNPYGDSGKFLQLNKMVFNYDWSDMELGSFTFDNTTKRVGAFTIPSKNAEISNNMNIISSPFGKALQLTKTSNTTIYFRINTGVFPVIGGRSLITNICKNIISQSYITIKYYDFEKNLLGQTSDYHYESNEKDGDLYMSDWFKRLYLPSNAYYAEVSISTKLDPDVTNFTIYGIFTSYE